MSNGKVLLIRHAQVALRWRGRCYGSSDVGLSRNGLRHSLELAQSISRQATGSAKIEVIVHSGLKRAAFLAHAIGKIVGIAPRCDPRWRERDFGSWEGRTWHSLWRETGNAMDRMLTDPQRFRPGGGETTAELYQRSVAAWNSLPAMGLTAVITHGGPIASVRCAYAKIGLEKLCEFRIDEGAMLTVTRSVE